MLEWINSRLDGTEEWISELEYRLVEIRPGKYKK